jgi:hypothetical protein
VILCKTEDLLHHQKQRRKKSVGKERRISSLTFTRRERRNLFSGMENIDPSSAINRQFFQHFTGHPHHHSQQQQLPQHQNSNYQTSHIFHQYPDFVPLQTSSGIHSYIPSSSCSFTPTNFSSPGSDHVNSISKPAGSYPPSNSALYHRDSYSESSSPNLNSSSGSTAFNVEHVTPYTPSPSESDSLDQTDSLDSCDPNSMTVDLDEDEDSQRQRRSRHRRRHRHSTGSPVVQRHAANLRERRRMQSINEAFEVSKQYFA